MLNKRITVHFAGEVGPLNPSEKGGWGFIIRQNEDLLHQDAGLFTVAPAVTDKAMEFMAIQFALGWLLERKKENQHVRAYGNEEMIIHQANGLWRPKPGPYMQDYVAALTSLNNLKMEFKDLRFTWIAKADNAEARELARHALRGAGVIPSSERTFASEGPAHVG